MRENNIVSVAVRCPFCGSDRVRVRGTDKNGVRRFYCLNDNCSHETFSERHKLREKVKCPHCGSERVCKNGTAKDGRQYYLCLNKDCPHKTFVERRTAKTSDPSYIRENEKLSAAVKCPFCGSGRVRVRGTDKNGVRRFYCLNDNCSHKTFSESYKSRENMKCPYCGSEWVCKNGTAKDGRQKYRCRNENCLHKTFLEGAKSKGRRKIVVCEQIANNDICYLLWEQGAKSREQIAKSREQIAKSRE